MECVSLGSEREPLPDCYPCHLLYRAFFFRPAEDALDPGTSSNCQCTRLPAEHTSWNTHTHGSGNLENAQTDAASTLYWPYRRTRVRSPALCLSAINAVLSFSLSLFLCVWSAERSVFAFPNVYGSTFRRAYDDSI